MVEGEDLTTIKVFNTLAEWHDLDLSRCEFELVAVSNGVVSLIDVVSKVSASSNFDKLCLSTWATSSAGLRRLAGLVRANNLDVRLLVDRSCRSRHKKYDAIMREYFNDAEIFEGNVHAKMFAFLGAELCVFCFTSMNLSKNSRMETFQVGQSEEIAKEIWDLCGRSGKPKPRLIRKQVIF